MSIQLVARVLDARDGRITGTRKLVLLALANRADEYGLCWPSQGLLAGESGISVRALSDHLKTLESDGFIRRDTRHLGVGRGSKTFYKIDLAAAQIASENIAHADIAHAIPVDCTGSSPRVLNHQEPSDPSSLRSEGSACERERPKSAKPKAKARAPARGTRLPDEWAPDPSGYQTATNEGLTPEEINRETVKFRDFWHAKSGKDAAKADWHATWRNWVRRAGDDKRKAAASGYLRPQPGSQPGGSSLAAVGLRLVAKARGHG